MDERGLLTAQLAALNGKLSGQTGVEESLRAQNEQMKREIGAMQARARRRLRSARCARSLALSLPRGRALQFARAVRFRHAPRRAQAEERKRQEEWDRERAALKSQV